VKEPCDLGHGRTTRKSERGERQGWNSRERKPFVEESLGSPPENLKGIAYTNLDLRVLGGKKCVTKEEIKGAGGKGGNQKKKGRRKSPQLKKTGGGSGSFTSSCRVA